MVDSEPTSDIKTVDPSSDAQDEGLTFMQHLDELRVRLMYSVLFLILGCVVSFIFTRSYIYPFIIKNQNF